MTNQPATETGRATQSTPSRLLTAGRISRYEYDAIEQEAAATERRRVVELQRALKQAHQFIGGISVEEWTAIDRLRDAENATEAIDLALADEVTTP